MRSGKTTIRAFAFASSYITSKTSATFSVTRRKVAGFDYGLASAGADTQPEALCVISQASASQNGESAEYVTRVHDRFNGREFGSGAMRASSDVSGHKAAVNGGITASEIITDRVDRKSASVQISDLFNCGMHV
jgi:hypothetical protein